MNVSRQLAGLLVAVNLVLVAVWLVQGPWTAEVPLLPFVWRDVAIVSFLAGLPLAVGLAELLRRSTTPAGTLVLALLLALGGGVLLLTPMGLQIPGLLLVMPSGLSVALTWVSCRTASPTGNELGLILLGVVVWAGLPWVYTIARIRHDCTRLSELRSQGRYGEARILAHRIVALDPLAFAGDEPVANRLPELDRIVRDLERQVTVPLAADCPALDRLERARRLAMLGRTESALAELAPLDGAEANSLRGTIHETRGDWPLALQAFQNARAAWRARPDSAERSHALAQATQGIAFSHRKQGDYSQAEEAYRELLALAPTADTHFLLAQFYEDTQQAHQAQEHARRAMALNPARYLVPGEKLLDQLATAHFGCLQVYGSGPPRSPTLSAARPVR